MLRDQAPSSRSRVLPLGWDDIMECGMSVVEPLYKIERKYHELVRNTDCSCGEWLAESRRAPGRRNDVDLVWALLRSKWPGMTNGNSCKKSEKSCRRGFKKK